MQQDLNVAAGVVADTSVQAMESESSIEGALQTLSDGAKGYRALADEIESADLRSTLTGLAEARTAAVEQVLRVAADAGIDFEPKTDGTLAGAAHRTWLKIESAISGEGALIESAEAAEDHAIGELEDALETVTTPDLAEALRSALSSVREAKETLATWRNRIDS